MFVIFPVPLFIIRTYTPIIGKNAKEFILEQAQELLNYK